MVVAVPRGEYKFDIDGAEATIQVDRDVHYGELDRLLKDVEEMLKGKPKEKKE